MRVLLSIVFVGFLAALAPLMPAWTPSAASVYAGLCVVCLGVVAAMWLPRRCNAILRVVAAVVGLAFVLSAIDFVTQQIRSGGHLLGGRNPVAGLVVIGLPALAYAITGRPRLDGLFIPCELDEQEPHSVEEIDSEDER